MTTVLVTGATRGIGQAIAKKFLSEKWHVIGTATQKISRPEYLHDYVSCDFDNYQDIENLCRYIDDQKIDCIVNNAGINIINDFLNITSSDFEKIQRINVYAPFRLCQSVLPYMIKQKWGRIVNISSVWGKISKKGRASYSASKFGIDGLTLAMANEYASQGILCNCVSPGFIDTEMTWNNLGPNGVQKILENVPINRLAKVEEVADLVYMLGSSQNTYISGQNISIDGGFTRA
jgi:NAD(P)-dependent dehydrogenase (short-subunit alcohol dehydrogenase family)